TGVSRAGSRFALLNPPKNPNPEAAAWHLERKFPQRWGAEIGDWFSWFEPTAGSAEGDEARGLIAALSAPQWDVYNSDKRFRVLVAGRRFGKTFLSIPELLRGAW